MDQKAGVDCFFQTVILSGAKVLADKSHDCDADGVGNGPINRVNLSESGPGCNGIGTQGIDGGLNKDIGNTVHGRLHAGGQADAQHAAELKTAEAAAIQLQTVDVLGSQ